MEQNNVSDINQFNAGFWANQGDSVNDMRKVDCKQMPGGGV
jgi:hypothetical protein